MLRSPRTFPRLFSAEKGIRDGRFWASFASHVSKTVGQALRHELMPRVIKSAMIRMAGFDSTYFFLNGISIEPNQDVTIDHSSNRKAEYVLQGNLLIALHEQTRLVL